jgi:solute carrier family 10 (sodium/bile acid cotransporter), member 7
MANESLGEETPADGEVRKSSKTVRVVKRTCRFVLANWLVIGFGLATLLAYLFPRTSQVSLVSALLALLIIRLPEVACRGGYIRSEYSILYGAIALIFFINGMQLSPAKLREHITNWRLHLVVQGIGFVIIPVIMISSWHISRP